MRMINASRTIFENKRGFTLLEVCIAMAVLAIALLGVTSMQINAVRNVSVGNFYSQANVIANQRIEELKNIPLDLLDSTYGVNNPYTDPTKISATTGSDPECPAIYTRTTTIRSPNETPPNLLDELVDLKFCRLIIVRVSWTRGSNAGTGFQRSITVRTLARGEGI